MHSPLDTVGLPFPLPWATPARAHGKCSPTASGWPHAPFSPSCVGIFFCLCRSSRPSVPKRSSWPGTGTGWSVSAPPTPTRIAKVRRWGGWPRSPTRWSTWWQEWGLSFSAFLTPCRSLVPVDLAFQDYVDQFLEPQDQTSLGSGEYLLPGMAFPSFHPCSLAGLATARLGGSLRRAVSAARSSFPTPCPPASLSHLHL